MDYIREQFQDYDYGFINDRVLVDRIREYVNEEIADSLCEHDFLVAIRDAISQYNLPWHIYSDIVECIDEKIENLK